ncbi:MULTISPECIES: DUF2637 domain-containing protein [unclassified Streptomyces]|uniref:DUF2637 domain-containing protein n=1 Tax=unclassified Streptomyces TaxID=2593676 RepID=UPI00278C3781|nr:MULTISPECIES: DUF2637 domain-containing protein [unclassified Streptomyces]
MTATPQLTKTHKVLVGVVGAGAVVIAAIGFAGSYSAVRELALRKGFGDFSYVFPIGIDAGICVLLALDLLLTWLRIPFPLLRQTAWLLTAATIAFNGAAAWPDPLGVGMHAVIPVLFVVAVEAARHAIGRIADITADKHMEGVRITRWLLAPLPTFLLWRRMKLWELRSYDATIKLEQQRLVYQARLRAKFGRGWRRKAPVESLMPLRLARYGVPLHETAEAGLAAAGIPMPAELQRLDVASEVPEPARELDPAPLHTDLKKPLAQDEAQQDNDERQSPRLVPEQARQDSYEEDVEFASVAPTYWGDYATAPSAARDDGRPVVVQARVDLDETEEAAWAEAFQGIGRQGGPEPKPEPEPEPTPELKGASLVEYLYLKLPLEEREGASANALAPKLATPAGLTVGTTRKYLGPVINKHATESGD